ncbi:hypothetical protein QMK17_10110 [Rhodococcus sp. G-MC3]|uniref:hypothetical protein n=1 Tax=Rhodococcus sp. G-MC3 TaxID=3046209 RepID=UPI0024B8B2F2|nr:hypothetical protein [Rhodococcus sp. G-MC3]MDJ0393683.1 hypothetical protein [Rhodococcus sp. G-MC3]
MKRAVRRMAVLATLVAAPVALGAGIGSATADAAPWHVGPVYRAEMTGEGAQYFCSKAQALEQSSQSIVLVPCTQEGDVWYRVVVNPYNWGFSI